MRYSFNEFILDTDCFELSLNGLRQSVEPQAISLLIFLIEHHDRMVTKEEIYKTIWKGRVVSEAALSSRIKMIRHALADDGRKQHTIRTIHGKGFRFIAKLDHAEANKPTVSYKEMATSSSKPAVAVLPFVNLSSEGEQEYFSDGITADIIAFLGKHRWLNVIARNTTFCYKGKAVDIRELGKDLQVSYVVEGNVQRAGKQIRVGASLIDANTGHQLWGDQYDGDITDIFKLQDEITKMLVARLEPQIGFFERERVVQSRPANLKAWDCFHLGVYHFFKFTDSDNLEAQQLLLQSRALDPNFGEALSWWAYAVILGMVYWSTKPSESLLNEAIQACDKAVSLDNQNATFCALRARALLANCEYDRAITENQRAIQLNPTFAAAHCGLGDSLAYEGRYDEAISCFEKAIALSPNDPQLWAFYSYGALALIFSGDYTRAVEWAGAAVQLPNCQYWAYAHQLVALTRLKQFKKCEAIKTKLIALCPQFNCGFAREKLFYVKREEQLSGYIKGLKTAGF